jgi:L-threonylcarbamoyladenylate synthase
MNDSAVNQASEIIKSGGVVAFPTETVYGLGADASNAQACLKIFKIKGRPIINPLIVHVLNFAEAEKLGEFNADARKAVDAFWPGPVSIVVPLKKPSEIANCVLAGNTTVALRVPSHKVARALLERAGCAIAAPSANPSGYISSTLSEHVIKHFKDADIFIIEDNDPCEFGLESTIIDCSSETPVILRYGFITPEVISKVLGKDIEISGPLMQIKAPGMLDKHYAPHTRLRLNATTLNKNEIGLNFGESNLMGDYSLSLSESGDLVEAASNLYNVLRMADEYAQKSRMLTIAVAKIPNIGIGLALNDRLLRAAK